MHDAPSHSRRAQRRERGDCLAASDPEKIEGDPPIEDPAAYCIRRSLNGFVVVRLRDETDEKSTRLQKALSALTPTDDAPAPRLSKTVAAAGSAVSAQQAQEQEECPCAPAPPRGLMPRSVHDVIESHQLKRTDLIPPDLTRHVERLESKARGQRKAASMSRYLRLDAHSNRAGLDRIVRELMAAPEVEHVYAELAAFDPALATLTDPLAPDQGYLDPAPLGIDAEWARLQPGGTGLDVGFADLEQGWLASHDDLGHCSPRIGDNRDQIGSFTGNHGTAVLGVIRAEPNGLGVVGIVPELGRWSTISHFRKASSGTSAATNGWVAETIIAALETPDNPKGFLSEGDVLLLEVQRGCLPAEVDDPTFDAIALAVANGVTVVEAAGNGGKDLDAALDESGRAVFNRSSDELADSGAIMVGAGESSLPHDRLWFSSYGSRVDCYAWGDSVVTCGYGDCILSTELEQTHYTECFSGTSAAAAIIAGAALALQGMYKARTGRVLSPAQMRALLADPATGTAQGPGARGHIGVMPDLRAIAGRLRLTPDVFIRDHACDDGKIPARERTCSCPDLAVVAAHSRGTSLQLGHGSGTEHDLPWIDPKVDADDALIYTRILNRGAGTAERTCATVYWAPPATVLTPDRWSLIGTTGPIRVPEGESFVVPDPIRWPQDQRAANPSECCWIVAVDSDQDTFPGLDASSALDPLVLADLLSWTNNLAVRSVLDIPVNPAGREPLDLRLVLAGAPLAELEHELEIVQQLPMAGGQISLLMPPEVLKAALDPQLWYGDLLPAPEATISRCHQALVLPPFPVISLGRFRLAAAASHEVVLRLSPETVASLRPGHRLQIRQRLDGREIGRLTWRFRPQGC